MNENPNPHAEHAPTGQTDGMPDRNTAGSADSKRRLEQDKTAIENTNEGYDKQPPTGGSPEPEKHDCASDCGGVEPTVPPARRRENRTEPREASWPL